MTKKEKFIIRQNLIDFYDYVRDQYNDDMYYENSDNLADEYLKSIKE